MTKYLYGASVQGIQGFVFQTNKLKEIVGASQLVDDITSSVFEDFVGTIKEDNKILMAAGNIKYIFDEKDKALLEKIVLEFPKHVSNYAPGITISQVVVKVNGNLQNAIDELEKKLKAQRNKVAMPVDTGFMALERARRTGGVGVEYKDGEVIDRGTKAKINEQLDTLELYRKFRPTVDKNKTTKNINLLTGKQDGSWIAIIHADGNGLGNLLQNMGKAIANDDVKKVYSTFSEKLETATKEAAQKAFREVIEGKEFGSDGIYPFRPVVLGGDDLTVIIRADLAYDFTKEFLLAFEESTQKHLKVLVEDFKLDQFEDGLTACAGIAYIKDSYPFHYGVDLAEALVKKAKKVSKSKEVQGDKALPPSSLAFYKVQSSFTEKPDDMIERTHSVDGVNKFFAGPYLTKEKVNGCRTTDELDELLENMQEFTSDKSKGISKIRQWISELHKDKTKAEFLMDRIKEVNYKFYNKLKLEKERKEDTTILSDLIDLHTFNEIYKEK